MKVFLAFSTGMFAVAFLVSSGCGDDDGGGGVSCAANDTRFCQCAGGEWGAQSCKPDGSGFGDCQCGTEGNDALALALTGHPSQETISTDTITISGTTPDGRGDTGTITVSNPESGSEEPAPISFTVINGAYSQEVSVSTGVNTIEVVVLEGREVVIEVTLTVTSTYTEDPAAGSDGGTSTDGGAQTDSDIDTDRDTDVDTDGDTDISTDTDTDSGSGATAGPIDGAWQMQASMCNGVVENSPFEVFFVIEGATGQLIQRETEIPDGGTSDDLCEMTVSYTFSYPVPGQLQWSSDETVCTGICSFDSDQECIQWEEPGVVHMLTYTLEGSTLTITEENVNQEWCVGTTTIVMTLQEETLPLD